MGATTAVLDAMMTTVLVVAAETGTTMITVAGVEEDIVMTVVDDALAAVVVVQHTVVAAAGKLDVSAKCFFFIAYCFDVMILKSLPFIPAGALVTIGAPLATSTARPVVEGGIRTMIEIALSIDCAVPSVVMADLRISGIEGGINNG